MNYSNEISECIEFIEENIKSDLTPEVIANQCGYSVFHFSRIFNINKGITLMEYVKKRRLSLAAIELFKGGRIIDIALDYGFETHNGFSKAFKKEFGFSPRKYIKCMGNYFNEKLNTDFGGCIMKPVIIKKSAFKVAGYRIKTNITNSNYTKDIASFWSNYNGENLESKMYKILNPPKHGEVGLCVPANGESGDAVYLLGVIVDNFDNVTNEMITVEVPEATYAVFTTPPVDTSNDLDNDDFPEAIKKTWKYIFEEWFKDSGYVFDESKLDFEFYDERCHGRKDTVMEIYVPIEKK
ncbi:AraC family transcriptional regulator [Clostridium botulinum A2B3 87]|uniref:AraC family transcriptional regulator n=1 Tax=Clostridium botulinum TaxID=1491 RepID=UPI0004A56B92|nr:AraC family transcriptional regulator [Clostridium botulinum]NFK35323.1 AraC family transcriptional regulator [Clostridium botulinum H04402 065]KEI98608.1 AraC family transcriptional regulator [Clostridium botulinum A2B3 87]NFB15774.1 AraC family transcriptional regulator [Clostridium botulinum]NFB66198.1 AraC family transcriptional regulator [Clostridium botulinum]NFB96996.1 AraC family transcriptional regulator [Clostridium botulinum]